MVPADHVGRAHRDPLLGVLWKHFHFYKWESGLLERISAPHLYFYNPRAQWDIEYNSQPYQLLTAFLPSYSDGMCLTQLLRSALL